MSNAAPSASDRRLLEAFLLAVAFAVAHTQSPLYFSNQNQYLLHGAAWGGHGHLANDWLAMTRDPTPVFSGLVALAYRVNSWLLQPAFFAMLMGYFLAARWLVAALPGCPDTRAARIAFGALFTAAHAAILRWASVQLTGGDYPWLLQAGLAAQYMVGPGIQPSAFGILLLVAVAAFAHGRDVLAAVCVALAVVFHGTYALHSALLTLGFMTLLALGGQWRKASLIGGLALLIVTPAMVYNAGTFTETDGYLADEARHILADIRIPHHCVASRWFDWLAVLQLVWMTAGLYLLRRSRVFLPLLVATGGCLLLTLLQLATGSDGLALMFPWRMSVLLVPLSTAVIFAKLLSWKPPGKWCERISLAGLLALVVGGLVVTACGLGYRMVDEHEIYDYIRESATAEDVYLIPTQFPAVGTGRGAVSNTFAPPPRAKEGTNQIPVDLQRFRLATGARIYVDFKSVPYAPREVLEWYRRMAIATDFYAKIVRDYPVYHEMLKKEGITYVVAPVTRPFVASFLEEVYSGPAYIVYRVK